MIKVKNGIDNLEKYLKFFKGKALGLITNPTGANKELKSTIDILNEKFKLIALYAPEHGVRGEKQAGEKVESYIDYRSGIRVYSLYGDSKEFNVEILQGIDALVFDIQDMGVRFYTYLYTLSYAMEACKKYNKEMIILDRINPLGRKIEGNILNEEFSSFIGRYAIPTRYGLTIGEFGRFINEEYNINCTLSIVPIKGWDGKGYFDDTDLIWIPPSPNIPTVDTAVVYIGTCIFEGTNVSEGRGTTKPFEYIGAPWLDSKMVLEEVEKYNLKGFKLREVYFTPSFSKYEGELCKGISIHVSNREKFKAYDLGMALLMSIIRIHPKEFKWLEWEESKNKYFIDLLIGKNIREDTYDEIISNAHEDSRIFYDKIKRHYIY